MKEQPTQQIDWKEKYPVGQQITVEAEESGQKLHRNYTIQKVIPATETSETKVVLTNSKGQEWTTSAEWVRDRQVGEARMVIDTSLRTSSIDDLNQWTASNYEKFDSLEGLINVTEQALTRSGEKDLLFVLQNYHKISAVLTVLNQTNIEDEQEAGAVYSYQNRLKTAFQTFQQNVYNFSLNSEQDGKFVEEVSKILPTLPEDIQTIFNSGRNLRAARTEIIAGFNQSAFGENSTDLNKIFGQRNKYEGSPLQNAIAAIAQLPDSIQSTARDNLIHQFKPTLNKQKDACIGIIINPEISLDDQSLNDMVNNLLTILEVLSIIRNRFQLEGVEGQIIEELIGLFDDGRKEIREKLEKNRPGWNSFGNPNAGDFGEHFGQRLARSHK